MPRPSTSAADKLPPLDRKAYLEHIRKINDTFYDQIKIADQKAAYVFTIMIAFMISSADGRGVFSFQRYASGEPLAILVSGFLAIAFLVTICSAIMTVVPRRVPTSTSLFWGAWNVHREAVIAGRETADDDYLFREYLGNADNLAMIAGSKYKWVGISFRALLVAVIAYALLLATL